MFARLLTLCLLTVTALAAIPAGWGKFKGAFFEVGIPPGFKASGQMPNPGGAGHDAVSLWNATDRVEFYVYSPQWNGRSNYAGPIPGTEKVTSRESSRQGNVAEEQLTITALDNSYVRFIVSRTKENENTNTTFGVRVPNMSVYQQIKPTYVRWKQTLQQFAD
ncbi:MAG: hypothetical protein JSR82_05535 [Verrucomicrobia bacterium]|nr:hypothetical protein [Verrucomicrobiota bacterium]